MRAETLGVLIAGEMYFEGTELLLFCIDNNPIPKFLSWLPTFKVQTPNDKENMEDFKAKVF